MAQNQWDWNTHSGNEAFDYYEAQRRGIDWVPTSHPNFDSSPTYQEDPPLEYSTPEYQYDYESAHPNQDHQYGYDGYSTTEYRYGNGNGHPTKNHHYGYDEYSTQEYNEGYGGYSSQENQYGYGPEYHSSNMEPEHQPPYSSQISDQEEIYSMLKLLLQQQEVFNKNMDDMTSQLDYYENDLYSKFDVLNSKLTYLEHQRAYTLITEDSEDEGEDVIQNNVLAEPTEEEQLADDPLEELAEEENGEAGYLHREMLSYEMLLDSHTTVDELGGFADLSKSNTDLMAALKGDEEEEQSAEEIDKEFEQLMGSPIDEDLVLRYEEEEQSAEDIDKEFEKLMGCTIDENLLICYAQGDDQEEEHHKTIMRHSTDLFKDIEEPEPPMPQLFNNHIFILPNTPTSSHVPGKTYFGKIRITEFKAWLYDALSNIPFEEIRMNAFKGWFYDEYDPGDLSFTITST